MLTFYLTQTRGLLQNPSAPTSLYSDVDLVRWINIARGQVTTEGECARVIGTISTVIGQRPYLFSDINTGVPATTGIGGVMHVRRLAYGVGDGQQWVQPRNWEWFDIYGMNTPVPVNGPPTMWAQYQQGGGLDDGTTRSGSFYIDPPPDFVYTLYLDCVGVLLSLSVDADIEALPYIWTDAVPFLAAYYALLSSQTSARQADANRMFETYQTFMERARKAANPSVNRWLYQGSPDPTMIAKLGLQQKAGANG